MSKPLRLLVVEDSEYDTLLLVYELRRGAFDPTFQRVDTAVAMNAALEQQEWDVVVADFSMPQFNAVVALELVKKKGLDVPFIIVSGTIGEEIAVKAMKNGAHDYIMKGNLTRLVPAVERELREAKERRKRKQAEGELRETREQFRVAREIQQRLFPKTSPQFGPFDLAGGSYPAEATGGDYFDYLALADGCLGVVVADATGHGIGPALLMAETRAYLRAWSIDATDVGEILTRTDAALAEDVDFERYVTMLLVKLDPASQSLVYASAGHPNGYVLDALGRPRALLKHTGAPLGLQHGAPYGVAPAVRLSAGDIVLLVTDGIEETLSPANEFFGAQRIVEVARTNSQKTAREILDALFNAARNFSNGSPHLDDLTVVVIKVNPPA